MQDSGGGDSHAIFLVVCAMGEAAFSKAALFSGHFEGWFAALWRSSHSSSLSGGRLSDMANLAWAKNAVLVAAERELEWEEHQRAANHPSKCPENRGVFEDAASPVAQTNERIAVTTPSS